MKNTTMNKIDLNTLSKEQLIKLILKQNTKIPIQEPKQEVIIVNKKQIKPIKKSNDIILTNELNLKNTALIKNRMVSLQDMRNSEMKIYKKNNSKKTHYNRLKFVELFSNRLAMVKKFNKVQMIIRVVLFDEIKSIKPEIYSQLPNTQNKNEKDEFNIKYKLVQSQSKSIIEEHQMQRIEKQYGPFQVQYPKFEDNYDDNYKFLMYYIINKQLMLNQSSQMLHSIGATLISIQKKQIIKHKMKGIKLNSQLISKTNNNYSIKQFANPDQCVIDYIWYEIRFKLKNYTYEILKKELLKITNGNTSINTEEIILWCKTKSNISIYAYDPFNRLFAHYNSKTSYNRINLTFVVKDGHIHGLLSKQMKDACIKGPNLLDRNLFHKLKINTKLFSDYDLIDIIQLKDTQELFTNTYQHKILILPKTITKLNDILNQIMIIQKFYVEEMIFNNNNQLTVIYDSRNNMIIINDDYENRFQLFKDIYKKYEFNSFILWNNQSMTQIANLLYEAMHSEIPQSCYSIHTRNIIDKYPPRPLYDSTIYTKKFDNVENYDICKAYSSILYNEDDNLIPIYSIHDKITIFKTSDLTKHGEFYCNKYILKQFNMPIIIEPAFYSKNYILYLINEMNMPIDNIKFSLLTNTCISIKKTFNEFIKFVYSNFSTINSKLMINSFIGYFNLKYAKSNKSVISKYESAMNLVMLNDNNKYANLTIEKINDSEYFLVKENYLKRLNSDSCSINRYIVSECNLLLLKLINKIYIKGTSKLICYNTDSAHVLNGQKLDVENKINVKFNLECIGKIYKEPIKYKYIERHYRENLILDHYKMPLINNKNEIIIGAGGSSKTTMLISEIVNCINKKSKSNMF